jgi:hypothetical protein
MDAFLRAFLNEHGAPSAPLPVKSRFNAVHESAVAVTVGGEVVAEGEDDLSGFERRLTGGSLEETDRGVGLVECRSATDSVIGRKETRGRPLTSDYRLPSRLPGPLFWDPKFFCHPSAICSRRSFPRRFATVMKAEKWDAEKS